MRPRRQPHFTETSDRLTADLHCKPCNLQRHQIWRGVNRERCTVLTSTAATKSCRRCGVEQPMASFYRHIVARDGRFGLCKACAKHELLSRQLDQPETLRRALDGGVQGDRSSGQSQDEFSRRCDAQSGRERSSALVRATTAGPHANPTTRTPTPRPLEVVWLCRRCRAPWDRRHPKITTASEVLR